MSIDISKLSDKELAMLKRDIDKTMKEREVQSFYKSELGITKSLIMEFNDELFDAGVSTLKTDDWFDTEKICNDVPHYYWMEKYEKAILSICDLTLGNWKANKKDKKNLIKIQCGTAVIPPNIDKTNYEAMVDDIFEVIKKYHRKEVEE